MKGRCALLPLNEPAWVTHPKDSETLTIRLCCIYSEFYLRQPANKNMEDIKTIYGRYQNHKKQTSLYLPNSSVYFFFLISKISCICEGSSL